MSRLFQGKQESRSRREPAPRRPRRKAWKGPRQGGHHGARLAGTRGPHCFMAFVFLKCFRINSPFSHVQKTTFIFLLKSLKVKLFGGIVFLALQRGRKVAGAQESGVGGALGGRWRGRKRADPGGGPGVRWSQLPKTQTLGSHPPGLPPASCESGFNPDWERQEKGRTIPGGNRKAAGNEVGGGCSVHPAEAEARLAVVLWLFGGPLLTQGSELDPVYRHEETRCSLVTTHMWEVGASTNPSFCGNRGLYAQREWWAQRKRWDFT